jgi:hypothetical protein
MDTARGVTTFAVTATTPTQSIVPSTVPIAILGTDAVLAAAPATPVQLAHACLRGGFANAIPASWGDELIAAAVLRRLPQFGSGPAIQCSCPIVAHRLLTASGDLRPVLLPLVAPPVAVARYVRSLARPARTRITYIGACPGAIDESIDIRMSPDSLIAMLAERDISLVDQPGVFESIIPPDRRRFRSQPGGVPTAEALWTEFGARTLVELNGEDFVTEVAQHLLTGKSILIDASTRLGCACSGAASGVRNPRAHVVALEPPRATSPVVEERTPIDLDLEVPAVPRTPVDVVAVSAATPSTHTATPSSGIETVAANPPQTARPTAPNAEVRLPRLSTPVVPRAVLSAFPRARDFEGKALPRAYVARRRSSPRGVSAILPPEELVPPDAREHAPEATPPVTRGKDIVAPSKPATEGPAPTIVTPTSSAAPTSPVLPESALAASVQNAATPPATPENAGFTVSDPVFSEAKRGVAGARTPPRPARSIPPSPTPPSPATAPATSFSRGQIILILIAVAAIAICASTVVGVIVSRSVTASSVKTTPNP